ncbi:MAG: Gfo/Idh/MocA family oxidoreductase [Bryobacterales bacterium]|nr:Gfo/Idh/MocA family oxidoreductase [Bryobacterales bacterium]
MQRRYFLPAAAAPWLSPRAPAAPDRVRIAVMGLRGRGRSLTREFARLPGVEIAWLCDPDPSVASDALQAAAEYGSRPRLVADIRRALDDPSLHALVIAAPDHWHAPATLLACQAGKDVYVEKPASHNVREGRLMIQAARRHRRIVQVGTQARSRPSTIRGIEYVRSGRLGRVLMAKAWNVQLRQNIGRKPDGPLPPGLDWDTWTGPALLLPFNENRFHYRWHWHWNYGTGDIGNDGVHQLDIARWALSLGAPTRVDGHARKLYFDDDQQTSDTMNLTYGYPDKLIHFEMRIWNPYGLEGASNAVAVYGDQGCIHLASGFKVFDPKGNLVLEEPPSPDTHAANFIHCVRTRQTPNADIAEGHLSALLAHLGNIVARTGRPLAFDPAAESIPGDPEANRLLSRQYRPHWSTPVLQKY